MIINNKYFEEKIIELHNAAFKDSHGGNNENIKCILKQIVKDQRGIFLEMLKTKYNTYPSVLRSLAHNASGIDCALCAINDLIADMLEDDTI